MRQAIFTTKRFTSIRALVSSNAFRLHTMVIIILFAPQPLVAGGVCVVTKELGNSLAVEWVASKGETVNSATKKAKNLLQQRGFTKRKLLDIHLQASTSSPHGHMVIIKSSYKTKTGNIRTSYGCGFSRSSSAKAERVAIKNLRSYSWGWKPEFGYELHARHSF